MQTAQKPKTNTVFNLLQPGGISFLLKTGRDGRLVYRDPDSGAPRAIRHCPNETSVFIDQQSNFANVQAVEFLDGRLDVKPEDATTLKFLELHPGNLSNGGAIFETFDPHAVAQEFIVNEDHILDIKLEIRKISKLNGGATRLSAVVGALSNNFDHGMEVEEMKQFLYKQAERSPNSYIDEKGKVNMFTNSFMKAKITVLKSIRDGILEVSPNNRAISWRGATEYLHTTTPGNSIIDSFSKYLNTNEGKHVMEDIISKS